jgi:uncharacterized protein YcbX
MTARLGSLRIYPLKSAAPLFPERATVTARGLVGDRRWMIVDAAGRFVTARKHPRLVLIRAAQEGDGLFLQAPGMPDVRIAPDAQAARVDAIVWNDTVAAQVTTCEADGWISDYLGFDARFVHMDAEVSRAVDANYAKQGDVVGFADGFPLLLITQAALDGLNARLAEPVAMRRFRPNLVVDGAAAHAEDGWRSIRIGEVCFDVVKPCARCVLTTVDPDTGCFDAQGEPLRTLIGYRRGPKGVMFGQNLIPRGAGTIALGDAVEVIG